MKFPLSQSIALTAAMFLCGCADSAAPESSSAGGDAKAMPTITPAVQPAPEIAVQVMSLPELKAEFSSQQGKVVVVDLWAMW